MQTERFINKDDLLCDLRVMLSTAKARNYDRKITQTIADCIGIVESQPYYKNDNTVVYRYIEGVRE